MLEESKTNAVAIMKRPKGVSVMGCVFLYMAYVSFNNSLSHLNGLDSYQPQARAAAGGLPSQINRLFAFHVADLLIALILGIALLNMKRWSRWATIAACTASLALIPQAVIADLGMGEGIDVMVILALQTLALQTLLHVWAIWYLTRPHIRAAFRSSGHQLE